ncbi:MAG TPA: hypothetical protein PKI03_16210 [Pseudomonadota bacterium]|nr:hypothetical protein [Pseudomonadota bacterium]
MHRNGLLLPVLFGCLLRLAPAQAQPAPASRNCVDHPACLALFEQAQQQSRAGQLAEALRSYSLAYQVTPDPRLSFSMGRVLQKQGRPADALPHYRQFIDSDVEDEEQKTTARSYLAQCEAALPPPPPVTPPPALSPAVVTPASVPVYRRWWFWTILGTAAAAGIAGGIAGGVIAEQNRLPALTFRPFE